MGIYAISGSVSGIGAATAAVLTRAGHGVIGIDLANAEVECDLATPEGRNRAVDKTIELCDGRLDGLVSCAGVGPPAKAELIVSVNYFGSIALLEGLRPALAASAGAQVVQLGSNSSTTTPNLPPELIDALLAGDEDLAARLAGEPPFPFDTAIAYGGSKLAISRWCRRAAVSSVWVGEGVTLNVIAPGPVQTPLLQKGLDDETFGPLMDSFPIPTGEPASAELIAEWIAFLLSPAARFACGSVIVVDGGADAVIRSDDWPATLRYES